jgi:hypothetical protein
LPWGKNAVVALTFDREGCRLITGHSDRLICVVDDLVTIVGIATKDFPEILYQFAWFVPLLREYGLGSNVRESD